MRIQHNIPAMNSYRNYNNNQKKLGRNLEKLSSGYAINRAGDDAAGLAISEKMRAQITGIEVASKNAKDGISVVQTAEGALTEVHDMLNRMFALAEQANNGIYQKEEREKLQAEIDQLATEIDRIGDSTNFNGMKLLDGTLQDAPLPTFSAPSASTAASDAKIASTSFKWSTTASTDVKKAFNDAISNGVDIKIATGWSAQSGNATGLRKSGAIGSIAVSMDAISGYYIKSATINKSDVDAVSTNFGGKDAASDATSLTLNALDKTQQAGGTVTITLQDANGNEVGTFSFGYGPITQANAGKIAGEDDNAADADTGTGTNTVKITGQDTAGSAVKQGALSLQIGDSTNSYDKMYISVDSMKSGALGVDKLDIITDATNSMGLITDAIEKVSVQRGSLGAFQNRLEHTLNNLSVMRENIQDAEATIRDTDMAEEMMKYTKNNILVQSAQAMLAQANQLPQGVLGLLQ